MKPKLLFVLLFFLLIVLIGFVVNKRTKKPQVSPRSPINNTNPFGMKAGVGNQVPPEILAKEKAWGFVYQRPNDVAVEEWLKLDGKCDECAKFKASGLGTILTIRNNGVNAVGFDARIPTTPPKDIEKYKQAVAQIIKAYEPEVVVIENEENVPPFYYDGTQKGVWDSPNDGIDTASEYAKELNAACGAAHQLGFTCSNGGMTSEAAAHLTWLNYLKQGKTSAACDFAKRAFYTKQNQDAGEKYCQVKKEAEIPSEMREPLRNGEKLLEVYKTSSIDYVNFHWYIRDAKAFSETAKFLKDFTNKKVMNNEIGQRKGEGKAESAKALAQAVVDSGLTYAVWYNSGTPDVDLFTDSGGNLTPSGQAIVDFIQENY